MMNALNMILIVLVIALLLIIVFACALAVMTLVAELITLGALGLFLSGMVIAAVIMAMVGG